MKAVFWHGYTEFGHANLGVPKTLPLIFDFSSIGKKHRIINVSQSWTNSQYFECTRNSKFTFFPIWLLCCNFLVPYPCLVIYGKSSKPLLNFQLSIFVPTKLQVLILFIYQKMFKINRAHFWKLIAGFFKYILESHFLSLKIWTFLRLWSVLILLMFKQLSGVCFS